MAISGRYTAVLDACVLFPRLQRDVLLSLAHADLYTARWTQEIEREWTTSVVEKYPNAGEKIPRLLEQMRAAVPDCLIVDYELLFQASYCQMKTIGMFLPQQFAEMQTQLLA